MSHETSTADLLVCPECAAGKHANCDGTTWDPIEDRPTTCECPTCGLDSGNVPADPPAREATSETPREAGCCDDCGGTGVTADPETNGRCWTCRGTGHQHDGPCDGEHRPVRVFSAEGIPFVHCSCRDDLSPTTAVWLREHWQGTEREGIDALQAKVREQSEVIR